MADSKNINQNNMSSEVDMPAISSKENEKAIEKDTTETREVAIKIENISKRYRLGTIGGRTLQADLQSWWAKKRGKEDPNLPIGMTKRLEGETFMALQDINLTVYKGEALGIIGSNGAGKSTLLKLLSQITAPTTGDIDLYGRVTSMLEIGTGFHGEMTGRQNVYMNGAILGMSNDEIDKKIEEIIDYSEVRDFIDTPVKRYSSGMFVKLAFSVAAHLDSEIMIMDEVLAVGDMAFQEKCLKKMRSAAEEDGRTVLYVSHNMNTIRQLCNRCIVLSEGKIIFDGDVDEAIAIYMNKSLGEDEVNIDLTSKEHMRDYWGVGEDDDEDATRFVEMTNIKLLNKVQASYAPEEDMELKLSVRTSRPVKNIKFGLNLRNNVDLAIGTAMTELMDFDTAGVHEITMKMPLKYVEKGMFYCSVSILRFDEIGHPIPLDMIDRAFSIKLLGRPNWFTRSFGYVKLPDIEVEEIN